MITHRGTTQSQTRPSDEIFLAHIKTKLRKFLKYL